MRVSRTGLIVAWGLGAALIAANVAGYAFDLYRALSWFDRVLHASTLLALTYWLVAMAFAGSLTGRNRLATVLLIAAIGVSCGALWEVAEWTFNKLQPADLIKGKNDTILDIIMDTIGSLLAAVLIQPVLTERRR